MRMNIKSNALVCVCVCDPFHTKIDSTESKTFIFTSKCMCVCMRPLFTCQQKSASQTPKKPFDFSSKQDFTH